MRRGMRLPSPALVVAGLALFIALGGTVYAAEEGADRRQGGEGEIAAGQPGEAALDPGEPAEAGGLRHTLGPGRADHRRRNRRAHLGPGARGRARGPAPTQRRARSTPKPRSTPSMRLNAQTVNGHGAGCLPGTQQFAGACWQSFASETAVSAPAAANSCAVQGGTLPEALQLAAFSQQPGVVWMAGRSGRVIFQSCTAPGLYAVVTVSSCRRRCLHRLYQHT